MPKVWRMLKNDVEVSIWLFIHWKTYSRKNDADIKVHVIMHLAIRMVLFVASIKNYSGPYNYIAFIRSLSPCLENNFQILISNLINVYTHQIFTTKDNPAADPRQMRRIIAEDPDWLVNISFCNPTNNKICYNFVSIVSFLSIPGV